MENAARLTATSSSLSSSSSSGSSLCIFAEARPIDRVICSIWAAMFARTAKSVSCRVIIISSAFHLKSHNIYVANRRIHLDAKTNYNNFLKSKHTAAFPKSNFLIFVKMPGVYFHQNWSSFLHRHVWWDRESVRGRKRGERLDEKDEEDEGREEARVEKRGEGEKSVAYLTHVHRHM